MIYLIEYDRAAGLLKQAREFPPERMTEAEDERLALEISLLNSGVKREIVLLEATSIEELHRTHRRYFEKLEELVNSTPSTL